MGGVQFENLSRLAEDIWDWCEKRDIWIFASYISSKDNADADFESRKINENIEFEISQGGFLRIINHFGTPEIDLFATRVNRKCEKFVSWKKDPESIAVGAFTIQWKGHFFYAFPPFSTIPRVLQKIKSECATYPGCRDFVRKSFELRGTPADACEIILSSLTDSSWRQYNSELERWWKFRVTQNKDPFDIPIDELLKFLTLEYNKAYGSLNSVRSAIALLSGPELAQDFRIKRFFTVISKARPGKPKYNFTWDPRTVLDFYRHQAENDELALKELSIKLTILLALVTAHRHQTLALIKLDNISERNNGLEIRIPDRIKTSGVRRKQPVLRLPFFEERKICVASALLAYIRKTRDLRENQKELFISVKRPHKAVGEQTLSHWIKTALGYCKIDTQLFSGYSTRHASTSAALRKGINIAIIKDRAGWTQESRTFANHYNLPLVEDSDMFARAILSS